MTTETIPSGIRGLSEQRRSPRLGKIRLGKQVPNANGRGTHPVMTDHFVFDDDAVGRQLLAMFGPECREIRIAFASDEPAEFARRNLECWGAGTLKCRGDGRNAVALVDPAEFTKYQASDDRTNPPLALWSSTSRAGNEDRRSGPEPTRERIVCLGLGYDGAPACPQLTAENCSPTLHLEFVVRGFAGLGIFQIDSGSVVNLQRVDDFVAYLGRFTGGRFAMVPLLLRLEPYEMRGRRFYGLQLDVDLEALRASGLGALPAVGALTIPERAARYLPEATQRPALPAVGAVVDEPPSDVVSGEVLEAEGVELEEPSVEAQPEIEATEVVEPDRDDRLGAFASVGALLMRAHTELSLNGPQVREVAGVARNAHPSVLLEFDGDEGVGLDGLWTRLALHAATAEVPA